MLIDGRRRAGCLVPYTGGLVCAIWPFRNAASAICGIVYLPRYGRRDYSRIRDAYT